MMKDVLGDIPADVLWVWVRSQYPMGLDDYQKCQKIIKDNPKYFAWETKYSSIPEEVHIAYRKEKYPDWDKPLVCRGGGKGILEQIKENSDVINIPEHNYANIEEIFADIVKMENDKLIRHKKERDKEKALWDKHYRKYKLEYRG